MRLERLEINGFKSFSDRSELAFDQGVTAIVGPNGCGKSNVADAITWVMGEQSAKSLRGERMEDVIFSGSDARRPNQAAEVRLRFSGVVKSLTGPAFPDGAPGNGNGNGHANGNGHHNGNGHASGSNGHNGNGNGLVAGGNGHEPVALALEPLDAEDVIQTIAREVEVTRRLYRSGESEYLIDGEVCRLRDIHDLLMDTGLGAKAYAIIEQGKIGLILSSRPADRRQLIEEAAGVTKYKARKRSAELKLEAAQQNLTRVDDIVFEVEKQRGTLKRQAGKARRYRKLRDELRRWEKVLFSRKYRQLSERIESARARLEDARNGESLASSRVAGIDADLGRVRIELAEAESRVTTAREGAHASELAITRLQQQIAFDQEQVQTLGVRASTLSADLATLNVRREPARAELASRRGAAEEAALDRDRAAAALAAESGAYDTAHREIEGLEADVEAARSEVFSAINSATALRHSLEHAAAARERVSETLTKLQVESDDWRISSDRMTAEQQTAQASMGRSLEQLESTRAARAARESELASARIELEWRLRSIRAHEHDLASLEARLMSLEELEAARAGYGDAARVVLARANGAVNQQGAVADYLDVDAGYERAVEACLGDILQHVVVPLPEHAAAGLRVLDEEKAGRCGFLIASAASGEPLASSAGHVAVPDGVATLSSVVHVHGPFAGAIRLALGEAWLAESYGRAAELSASAPCPVAARGGELFRGPSLMTGGTPVESRGILETKREIKELVGRIDTERTELGRLGDETAGIEAAIARASSAITGLQIEQHQQEKTIVALEAQLQRTADETMRLSQKADQLGREKRQAEEERDALDSRQAEARMSIVRLEGEQREADERLTVAQRRLFEAREATEDLGRRAAEAGAAHAALVERASALLSEVRRLEDGLTELESRAAALVVEIDITTGRVAELRQSIVQSEARLDEDVRVLEGLRGEVQRTEATAAALRTAAEEHESAIKIARIDLEAARAVVSEIDIARVTAESDLAHLSSVCLETVQASLTDVLAEVTALEQDGALTPDVSVICGDDPDESSEEGDVAIAAPEPDAALMQAERQALSAEEAIVRLREKIERLGPVNMMAIEQFDDLESRHTFLSTQRKDLVDSIAQTAEAIKRIDQTTQQRFTEAFASINRYFQEIFSTLFGGGRAGLALLDESDPMESGIEVVAQPPGKRLQSVQLLSGGEKALTAISLMFALFKYKPSPFCLLDEIDAPLDDANIGRFVEMLRSMQAHTQFILITHNRKTMEIADRLYGVTMEEPGVSKLISVQLN